MMSAHSKGVLSMRQRNHRGSSGRCAALLIVLSSLAGCEAESGSPVEPETGTPVSQAEAAKVKSGMTRAAIEAVLGPGHPASSMQREHLDKFAEQIPAQARATMTGQSTDIAWGNSKGWLAARFSPDNHSWLVTWESGSGSPHPPGPPPEASKTKVFFRDFSKPGR
jgi:hypothetical protein